MGSYGPMCQVCDTYGGGHRAYNCREIIRQMVNADPRQVVIEHEPVQWKKPKWWHYLLMPLGYKWYCDVTERL